MKIYGLQELNRKKIENPKGLDEEKNINKEKNEIKVESLYSVFGDPNITPEGKISGQELLKALAVNDSLQVKVEAVINSVCQTKGCWMYVDLGEENEMLVRFKDYGFFVPMQASGKTAVIEGLAKVETLSVEWLKHLKEDANAPQEEIDAITEPKTIYSISEATGVIIYNGSSYLNNNFEIKKTDKNKNVEIEEVIIYASATDFLIDKSNNLKLLRNLIISNDLFCQSVGTKCDQFISNCNQPLVFNEKPSSLAISRIDSYSYQIEGIFQVSSTNQIEAIVYYTVANDDGISGKVVFNDMTLKFKGKK